MIVVGAVDEVHGEEFECFGDEGGQLEDPGRFAEGVVDHVGGVGLAEAVGGPSPGEGGAGVRRRPRRRYLLGPASSTSSNRLSANKRRTKRSDDVRNNQMLGEL